MKKHVLKVSHIDIVRLETFKERALVKGWVINSTLDGKELALSKPTDVVSSEAYNLAKHIWESWHSSKP